MAQQTSIQFRRGTASDWANINPTLSLGEPGIETDTRKMKVGDGSTAWNNLRYVGLDGGDLDGGGGGSPSPTATPAPQPTATPAPQPTATPAPQPTATPAPQPTSTPGVLSLAITEQPKNDFTTTYTESTTFSVAAVAPEGATLSYQWQYYGYDFDTYTLGWQTYAGKTSSTLTTSLNAMFSEMLGIDPYQADIQLRCVVTDSTNATVTSVAVRLLVWSQVNPQFYPYGYNGSSATGSVAVGGDNYTTFSPAAGEAIILECYDPYGVFDQSWYSSNAITLKLQDSTDASTWSDVTTLNLRTGGFYEQIMANPSTGQKYYRVIMLLNWPFTITNGTASSTKSAPAARLIGGVRVTWP